MPTKAQRANMTEEQKQRYAEKQRQRWANRTEEEKQRQKEKTRERYVSRSEEINEAARQRWANMTEEGRELKKEQNRQWRANMTEERKQQRYKRNRQWFANMTEEQKEQYSKRTAVSAAKARSRKHGLPFNLTFDYINEIWPDGNKCPVFGVPMVRGQTELDARPNLDRIEPSKGYVMGNVRVMSGLANRIKTNATPAQVLAVGQYLVEQERKRAST